MKVLVFIISPPVCSCFSHLLVCCWFPLFSGCSKNDSLDACSASVCVHDFTLTRWAMNQCVQDHLQACTCSHSACECVCTDPRSSEPRALQSFLLTDESLRISPLLTTSPSPLSSCVCSLHLCLLPPSPPSPPLAALLEDEAGGKMGEYMRPSVQPQ